jgi:hypothetical protein
MKPLLNRLECRCPDRLGFRAVRALDSFVSKSTIEVGEVGGEFLTHQKFVSREIPARVGGPAASHLQREGIGPREFVRRVLGHRFQ